MRLTKIQSRVLAVGVLALFFGVSVVVTTQSKKDKNVEVNTDLFPKNEPTPDSKFVLKEFSRSETRDGKKLWEVKAKSGQYYPESNTAKLEEATLWMFRDEGGPVELKAGHAKLYLKGVSLASAQVEGNVVINYPDKKVTLETDAAEFNQEKNSVSALGKVTIHGELLDIVGEGLSADLNTREFHLERDVKTVVKPKRKS